jgi:hypothetical protein
LRKRLPLKKQRKSLSPKKLPSRKKPPLKKLRKHLLRKKSLRTDFSPHKRQIRW